LIVRQHFLLKCVNALIGAFRCCETFQSSCLEEAHLHREPETRSPRKLTRC